MSNPSRPCDGPVTSRLLHPLTAGFMLTSAGSLSAEIVYNNTPVTGTQFFAINPGDDFQLSVYEGNETNLSTVHLKPQPGAMLTPEASLNDVISDGDTFSDTFADVPSGQHYYGFSLTDGSTVYGWMSVTNVPGFGTGTGTVNEWAYDTTGASIAVGQITAIPEPATTAAVAALLAGSAAVWKRRRQKLSATAA